MVRERKCLMNGKATGLQIKSLQTVDRQDDKCINCQSLTPKYICLDFVTFVCQDCSDIHRSFGHKSAAIDHSEWTPEEYAEIEKGGNKLAAQEFLAFWNQSDFPRPDRKETERLKDFIRKAYVIKCWQRQPDPKRAQRKSLGAIRASVVAGQTEQPAAASSATAGQAEKPAASAEILPVAPAAPVAAPAAPDAPPPVEPSVAAVPSMPLRGGEASAAQTPTAVGAPDGTPVASAVPQVAAAPVPAPAAEAPATPAVPAAVAAPGGAIAAPLPAATPALPMAVAAPGGAVAVPPAAVPGAGAAPLAAAPGAGVAPAYPNPGMGLVYLPKDSACFCPDHNSTEKRHKTEPAFKTCNGCKLMLQTNYSHFSYCPGCSAERSLCMICGVVVGGKYGPDGMPVAETKCASRECSDGIQTDEATSVGNPDAQVDFSSSDAEGADHAVGPALAAAAAPTQASTCVGNLMDLDVPEAVAPVSSAPEPAAAEAQPVAAPAEQAASPNDWLGEAIVSAPSTGAPVVEATVDNSDVMGAPEPSSSSTAAAEQPSEPVVAVQAAVAQAVDGDDWLGEAVVTSSASASASNAMPAEVPADIDFASAPSSLPAGAEVPSTLGLCEEAKPATEPPAQAVCSAEDPFAGLDGTASTAAMEASPRDDRFAALAVESFPSAPSAEASPSGGRFAALAVGSFPSAPSAEAQQATSELVLQTPKRNSGDVFGAPDPQSKAVGFFCGSPPALPGSASVQDRFAALGDLPLPGQRPAPTLPAQPNFSGAGMPQMGSPMAARSMPDTPLAMMSPQALMTPKRFDDVSSDHLNQMHAMVTRALQQRSQAGSVTATPLGSPSTQQMSPMMGGACPTPWSGVPEPPQLQFGDVLSALHEKQIAAEDKQMASPAKTFEAFDSALMSVATEPEQPKEFGDLLAAFHKKNPIAGFTSPA